MTPAAKQAMATLYKITKAAHYGFGDLEPTCGGTRMLECFCCGDFCCCPLGGGIPCPGCDDCDYLGQD